MLYEAIDHVIIPVGSVDAAAKPYERLGLRVTPAAPASVLGNRKRAVCVGDQSNLFFIELLEPGGRAAGQGSAPAVQPGHGLFAVALRALNLQTLLTELGAHGVELSSQAVFDAGGAKVADIAFLLGHPAVSVNLVFVQYVLAQPDRHGEFQQAGSLDRRFTLKRLDHLAAMTANLEASTRFWTEVLGIPLCGEVVSPVTIVRQFKIGDAIIELLGPATPDSPTRNRPPGLSSMTAFEVPNLDAAVAQARSAGFNASDPATGTLPGTRVARIPAEEFDGLGIQLLQYV